MRVRAWWAATLAMLRSPDGQPQYVHLLGKLTAAAALAWLIGPLTRDHAVAAAIGAALSWSPKLWRWWRHGERPWSDWSGDWFVGWLAVPVGLALDGALVPAGLVALSLLVMLLPLLPRMR